LSTSLRNLSDNSLRNQKRNGLGNPLLCLDSIRFTRDTESDHDILVQRRANFALIFGHLRSPGPPVRCVQHLRRPRDAVAPAPPRRARLAA
jgi:hypothetical protein